MSPVSRPAKSRYNEIGKRVECDFVVKGCSLKLQKRCLDLQKRVTGPAKKGPGTAGKGPGTAEKGPGTAEKGPGTALHRLLLLNLLYDSVNWQQGSRFI
jgi:hypothetical protein